MKRVAVIGAGPAGTAAALSLLRHAHIEVLLLDKATFPRRKVCGSGLSPWALDLLDEMGIGQSVRREAYPIRAGRIAARGSRIVELRSDYEAAVLLRTRFDAILVDEATRRGAELRDGTHVRDLVREKDRLIGIHTSGGPIEVDAAIVCSGAKTKLAKEARPGRTLNTILGWYQGVADVSDAVELYFDDVVKPYYGWVFPEGKDRVNIGICYAPTPDGPNARARLETFLETRLAGRLHYAEQIGPFVGHPIATTSRPAALSQSGVLVAGEAGNLVDPATAEGIHQALASGQVAGAFLGRLFERGGTPTAAALAPYTALIRQRIGRRLLAGQVFHQVARTPVFDFAFRFGSTRPIQSVLTWALSGA